MIRFACPSCSASFSVADDKAGKTSNCPKCKTQFIIPGDAPPPPPPPISKAPAPKPEPATVMIDPCPKCRTQLTVETRDLGTDVECPSCQTVFTARKPGSRPQPPPRVERPRSRREEEDDADRRDRRGNARREERDDEDDDRPQRRSSRREEDDFDDRPRRDYRRRQPASGTGQGMRVTSAVFGFIIGSLMLLCGVAIMVMGTAVLDMFTGVAKGVATAKPPVVTTPNTFPRGGFQPNPVPNNPNANAAAAGAIAGVGWITGGVVIGCGLVSVFCAIAYIVGAIGVLQRRVYGKILTIIAAALSVIFLLFAVYGLLTTMGVATVTSVLTSMISIAIYAAHSITSFMACFGNGSNEFY